MGDVEVPLAVASCHAGICGLPICIEELGDVVPPFCLDKRRDLSDLSSDCNSLRVLACDCCCDSTSFGI